MLRVPDRPFRVRARARPGARARFAGLAIALSSLAASSRAGAQAPPLTTDPVWDGHTGQNTRALAVADVDLDGDLDVVCGTDVLQLYLNRAGELESEPTWSTLAGGTVSGVALGDLNGDGRPDLVVSVAGDTVGVYWSSTSSEVFPVRPSLRIPVGDAAAVILADVDADGDADVVCAGRGSAVTVHRNDGGAFSAAPVWTAAGSASRLAAGDVDGDGRLDLFASDAAGGVRLYHGEGDAFGAAPVWSQAGPGTTGVALGDLDGDGDLDLAVGGTAPAATRVFENQSGTFAPAFTFGAEDSTATLALGDVDADGDLDLACGNTGRSRVYRNDGALTQWSVAWDEPPGAPAVPAQVRWLDVDGDVHRDLLVARDDTALYRNRTPPFGALTFPTPIAGHPLAVTDLNGDTRPDLVVASAGGTAALHWNLGTRFDSNAAWTSAPGTAVNACAAGDVDGDGDLDLVVAGTGIALYLHDGTTLATVPAWTQALDGVTALAVRDVDRDGRVDIVVGSSREPTLACFLNRGGTFRDLPDWEGRESDVTSIALADTDGDGDLDLAVGTSINGTKLFECAGGDFGAAPRFTFSQVPGAFTRRVFLDDVDGDADPDLVLANAGKSASFTNFGGFFSDTPSQVTPTARLHRDGVLEDLDADGDLDLLLLAAPGDVTEFYAGGRGQFDAPTPLPDTNAEHVQAADVDDDGDIDLVTGGDTGFVTVVAGTAGPVTGPNVHALPDQAPWLRSVRMAPGGRNVQHFTAEAFDAEGDSVWIVAESQVRGSRIWEPMDERMNVGGRRGLRGPFGASATGAPLEFDWDITRLPTTREPFQVRFRTVPVRSRTGESQVIAAYAFAAGPLRVERPIIAAEPQFMRFSRVTVGDTTSAVLTVRNDGTEPLVISEFEFQGTRAMRTNPMAPLTIGPGAHSEVFLFYEPQVPESSGPVGHESYCHVHSNDPEHPRTTINLSVEAAALGGRAQALLPESEATLGEPVVVQATPDPAVHIEHSTLYAGSLGGPYTAFTMTKRPGDFIGTIPGSLVSESGMEFYVEFENSGVLTTDPPGAPDDSVFTVPIGRPSHLVVTPQPTSRFDFLVGRDINVDVRLELGAQFTHGTLFYRRGGEVNFTTEPVLTDYTRFVTRATIPASAVGPRGLEFYARVYTLRDSLVYPASGPGAPDSIRTLAPSLSEPGTHTGERYRMLSVPLDFGIDAARTLDALLADQPEFGPYDPVRWRAFRYLGAAGNVERQPADARFTVVPGRAFWLVSRAAHRVDTAPIEGLSVSLAPFPLVLEPGWNQIGNPFAFPVRWSRVRHSAAIEDPVAFDPDSGPSGEYRTEPAAVLAPFDGYFVFNRSAQAETLFVTPADADVDPAAPAPAGASAAVRGAWSVEVAAHSRAARDGGNRAVVDARAQDGRDGLDRQEPPVAPAPWVCAAFRAADPATPSPPMLLRTDARAPAGEGQEWRLEVTSSAAAEILAVDVRVDGELPAGFLVWMLDEETGSVTVLDAGTGAGWVPAARLRSHGPDRVCRLRLLAGTPDWLARTRAALVALPARVTLAQNSPNPFNATTRVRFGLPEAASAALEIFDARGRRVAVLVNESLPAGWHDRLWDGHDTQGRPVATGIYFCRLRAGSAVQTRRLVLVE